MTGKCAKELAFLPEGRTARGSCTGLSFLSPNISWEGVNLMHMHTLSFHFLLWYSMEELPHSVASTEEFLSGGGHHW